MERPARSNVAFLVVGLAGIRALLGRGAHLRDSRERGPWVVFFAGVVLTSAGSAWFHLAPSVASLVWDRLRMAIRFMRLLAGLITERIDPAWGRHPRPAPVSRASSTGTSRSGPVLGTFEEERRRALEER